MRAVIYSQPGRRFEGRSACVGYSYAEPHNNSKSSSAHCWHSCCSMQHTNAAFCPSTGRPVAMCLQLRDVQTVKSHAWAYNLVWQNLRIDLRYERTAGLDDRTRRAPGGKEAGR